MAPCLMEGTLLVTSKAKRDVVEIKTHKQPMIKMDGSRK